MVDLLLFCVDLFEIYTGMFECDLFEIYACLPDMVWHFACSLYDLRYLMELCFV